MYSISIETGISPDGDTKMEHKYFKEFEPTDEQIAKIKELHPDEETAPSVITSFKEIGISITFKKAAEISEYKAFQRELRKRVYQN